MKFKSIDDIPKQIVFHDTELDERFPDRAFYLRLQNDCNKLECIDLDGVSSISGARKLAVSMGYNPTHWAVLHGDIQEFNHGV
jgi:hypothetical protein